MAAFPPRTHNAGVSRFPAHLQEAFARFTAQPTLLNEAVSGLGAGGLNRRLPGEDWSIRDVIVHLADSELVAAVRFRMVLSEDAPALPGYDGEAWKRRLHYLWRSPETALSLFQQVRFSSGEILQQCEAAAWARTGLHPTAGQVTLAAMLEEAAWHVEDHLGQIAKIRAG